MATANLLQTSVSGGTQNALSLQGDGVFFPKASTTSRLALTLTTTDKGFIVYDTTDNNIYFWNGAAWESVPSSGDAGANGSVQYNDNGIVSGATNFVWDKVNGRVGIGTASPTVPLQVAGAATITGDLTVDGSTLIVTASTDTVCIGVISTDAKFRVLDASGNGVRIGFSPGVLNYNLYDATIHEFRAVNGSNSFGGINVNGIGLGRIPAASGIGVAFLAAQSASSDANTLDDYEEGTWTPVATGLTNVGAVTYTATYTKIGRVVYINLKVTAVTSTTSVANTTFFSGLPFTPALNSTITAVNEGNITSLGVGLIATGSTVFTPNWTAVQNATISGFYYV